MKIITIILSFMALNIIIVYFGRTYYPDNFLPSQTPFSENLIVLMLGESLILVLIGFFFVIGVSLLQKEEDRHD